ncbi:hypothetical protein BIW11_03357 [Tropilaelaps mercedesae]|uniref:Uncharacterized protein n=1 Tax=Tropilaelaps mercedesae TaxID=418985 RepID=A0A1V9XMS0_9ACAR|nr:hypothetical protein BIW11_03357 [Tropilaelaps mercedesae]
MSSSTMRKPTSFDKSVS